MKTGIYQTDFKIAQPITVDGKQVDGTHEIEIQNIGGYAGRKKACVQKELALSILHAKPVKSGWQYSTHAAIAFVVDGQEYKPATTQQLPLDKEVDDFWESLIIQPTCETIQKLASGTSAQFRIDKAVIELSEADRATFREFANALGLP